MPSDGFNGGKESMSAIFFRTFQSLLMDVGKERIIHWFPSR